ncbi:TlyA family RNA methyltransferase [Aureibacillus halotolerans]|uniref:23S rRNA (Cytidine1920-2'-O)/16S rRNA (Cytidine1409-2'-O)-methyltransferase n=1 Tax=Aureibacillus halotolerans TaxID=1508390 RepID=A0A4R6U597_9BACI|nr:TlyA family RNA methyltransferase [Aureibacillus halotolerans]TDQ41640.1 23S rRNA (cytidine1920-2'-O)/16S rRNA (cytidine1409-2'-O)-methyltransferase [Aureibacillus halotolerans]
MKEKTERVDVLLVQQQLIDTREKAKRSIMAGLVFAGSERIDKPGTKLPINTSLRVKGKEHPYVGRGGLKLEKAISHFSLDLTGKIMVDIGASTGGFTDCALQNGATLVYAVDVGTNQLAWSLRSNAQVVVMEKTNFRYATKDMFDRGQPTVASIDVSFISLGQMFPPLKEIVAENADIIALIKPQFEAGRELVGKKGIVKDKSVHLQVIVDVIAKAEEKGFNCEQLTYSPITGGDGNIEFLAHFKAGPASSSVTKEAAQEAVNLAHEALRKASD